jgi:excisionase family DNA binding protein
MTLISVEVYFLRIQLVRFDSQLASKSFGPNQRRSTNMTEREEWLTPSEGAQYLKVKPRTLLLWIRQGKLKAYPLSGVKRRIWRLRRQDLDAALIGATVLPSFPLSVRSPEGRIS